MADPDEQERLRAVVAAALLDGATVVTVDDVSECPFAGGGGDPDALTCRHPEMEAAECEWAPRENADAGRCPLRTRPVLVQLSSTLRELRG